MRSRPRRTPLVYADPTARTVSFLETRDLDANTFWRLTVRKTF